jgi:DNA-binding transcriptional ArsR family regulator
MQSKQLADPEVVGEMAALMRLLGEPTRIRVLGLLQSGELNVTALCEALSLAQPTVSHHLALLRTAGLVLTRRAGKQIFYSLNPEHLLSREVEEGGLKLRFGLVKMCLGCNGHPAPASTAVA